MWLTGACLYLPKLRDFRPLLAIAAVFWLFACSNRTDLPELAPEVSFRTLSGDALMLGNINKPLLVSFWSTSCGICLEELPAMVELYKDYAASGFELIAVAMPYDPPNRVLELSEAHELPFPVAIDVDGQVLAAFEPVAGTPTNFLLDSNGQVVAKNVGALDFTKLRGQLDGMLPGQLPEAATADTTIARHDDSAAR
jgi:thiol-disulfide isomerase/thioredoxin